MKWENGSAFCFTKKYQAMAEYQYLYLLVLFNTLNKLTIESQDELHNCLVKVVVRE